jgi:glycosyltransferase involved in cell wall biosynthesis
MLASLGDAWVITRTNNRPAIEAALPALSSQSLHFAYVDLPPWARFWKRGQRGLRLYYLLWQVLALREARRLQNVVGFDIVWHLTLANAWLGSIAPLVGPCFVYGPVGGGVGTPWNLCSTLGPRGMFNEVGRTIARGTSRYLNPLARLAWCRANLILAQNPETVRWLPARHRDKAVVFPNPVLDESVRHRRRVAMPPPTVLFAGNLLPLKGVALVLQTLHLLPGWRLVFCGEGPEEPRLRRLATRLGLGERVQFRGWIARDELLGLMQEEADVLLFPSHHDEAGWVVVEAMLCGLPVVCLDRGGPPILGGRAALVVSGAGSPESVAAALASAVASAYAHPPSLLRERGLVFTIERRVAALRPVIQRLIGEAWGDRPSRVSDPSRVAGRIP